MTKASPRYMSFNLRSVDTEGQGEVWHWLVYEDMNEISYGTGRLLATGDGRAAASAAIALMGGVVRDTQDGGALSA